jgi:hypothetical protein
MKSLNKIFVLFLLTFISFNIFADSILVKLQNENPTKIIPMHEHLKTLNINALYTSEVYYLEFDDGLKAIFKTHPDDVENTKQNEAELMSYRLASALELNFVPRTCIRTLIIDSTFKTGCIKEYIDESLKFKNDKNFISFLENYTQENDQNLDKINALKIFYFILGQYDCSHHNLLITQNGEDYNFHAIDNGEIHKKLYVQLGNAPFTQRGYIDNENSWQKNFPFEDIQEYTSAILENFRSKFNQLPDYFIENIKNFEKNNPGKPFRFLHYKDFIWLEIDDENIDFFWKKITHCPISLKEKITSWIKNPKQLNDLFKNIGFYDKPYKDLLFNRLNQVLDLQS